VWFVWSCRSVEDLKWCWRTLQTALMEGVATGSIELPPNWSSATSATLGWLGVAIYVSQANKDSLLHFLGYDAVFDPHVADSAPGQIRKKKVRVRPIADPTSKWQVVRDAIKTMHFTGGDNKGLHLTANLYSVVSTHRLLNGVSTANRSLYVSSQQRDILVPGADGRKSSAVAEIAQHFLASAQDKDAEIELKRQINEHYQLQQRVDVGAWLKEQVIASSLDSNGVHVRSLLEDLVDLEDARRRRPARTVAVAYCGPNGLAHNLQEMCSNLGIHFEYLAHAE
jgi:hypothetical protein